MTILFQTERLIVRTYEPQQDACQAFAIYGDPEVMRFIGNGQAQENITGVCSLLKQRIKHYQSRNNGTGLWAVVDKITKEIIGTILLVQLPDNNGLPTSDYEIGWHFRRVSWGKGYATEAARGIIAYGFNTLQLPVLYAVVHPDNKRSIRVTQRLGMTPMGLTNRYYGVQLLLFKLESISLI
jgi:RimJ/RimL family protein N-acetyltransferase